jgi:hypothetical protein
MNLLKNSGYRGLSAIGLLAASFTGLSSAAEDPAVYSHVIAPIFEAKCVGCHGADKQKGKLRMDTYAALLPRIAIRSRLHDGSLRAHTLVDPPLTRQVVCVTHPLRPLSPAAAAFVTLLEQHAQSKATQKTTTP